MRIPLSRCLVCACIFQTFQGHVIQAGLNQFTEIDSLGKWSIEQKFNPEDNKVECRASMKGYGTWFGEKIRLDKNNDVIMPPGSLSENYPSQEDLEEIKELLKKCSSGLFYER